MANEKSKQDTARRPFVARCIIAITGPWTRRNAASWAILIFLVLTFRWVGCEPYRIPSGSMEPTLHGDPRYLRGDIVAVNKWVYGPRIPFTTRRLVSFAEPRRWDIVVFRAPHKDAQHKTLVKRIVGLPGERIRIKDGKIWADGTPVEPPEAFRDVLHYTTELHAGSIEAKRWVVRLAQHESGALLLNPENPGVQALGQDVDRLRPKVARLNADTLSEAELDALLGDLQPISLRVVRELIDLQSQLQYPLRYGIQPEDEFSRVPEGCYLVCGDNSPDSVDGRYFGWLPEGNIRGRAFAIWWPLDRWRDLTGFSRTWWGAGALYGIPVLLVAVEIFLLARKRRQRS